MSDEATIDPLPRVDRRTFLPAAAVFAVLVTFAGGYGFHRDELYFMANGRHPAWGYVDHPPMTPMLGWLSQQVFGDSLRGLRVLPALVAALTVTAAVLVCRELGGRASAQLLTAVAMSTTSLMLVLGHLLTTPSLDVLWWTVSIGVLVRLVRTGDPRWWLALGAVLGLGLLNKFTVLVAIGSYGLALLTQRERSLLRGPWLIGGVTVALAIWAPHLWWQIDHGWPVFEFSQAIADEATENRIWMLPFQVLLLGPPVFVVAAFGWVRLVRDPAWLPYRFVALGPAVCIVMLLISGGKPYYAAGALPPLLAAGSIVVHARFAARQRSVWLAGWLVPNLAVSAVIGLPLLPASVVGDSPVAAMNADVLETIGWPEFVEQVAAVADSIAVEDRSGAVVLTRNYGEAGALERWGPARGLPSVYSAHNSYADFGVPPDGARPVLVVGYDDPTEWFTGCSLEATLQSSHDVDNEENGRPVWLCTAPSMPWSDLWPLLHRVG